MLEDPGGLDVKLELGQDSARTTRDTARCADRPGLARSDHYRDELLALAAQEALPGSVDYSWLNAPASRIPATARSLIGWEVSANGVRIRLTELEAYAGTGEDPASHAHRGPTPRNKVMFGPAGLAYAYFVFGAYWCFNIVCGRVGEAAAVLMRAGEVLEGAELARKRRGDIADRDLARGPARLGMALGVGAEVNGTSMIDGTGPLLLTPPTRAVEGSRIASGPRVGVAAAHDLPWRFWIAGDPTVSPYRRHAPRRGRAGARQAPTVDEGPDGGDAP
jgi:DNA-3-methyladenine glycosylase